MYTWIFRPCKTHAFSPKSQPRGNNFAPFEDPTRKRRNADDFSTTSPPTSSPSLTPESCKVCRPGAQGKLTSAMAHSLTLSRSTNPETIIVYVDSETKLPPQVRPKVTTEMCVNYAPNDSWKGLPTVYEHDDGAGVFIVHVQPQQPRGITRLSNPEVSSWERPP